MAPGDMLRGEWGLSEHDRKLLRRLIETIQSDPSLTIVDVLEAIASHRAKAEEAQGSAVLIEGRDFVKCKICGRTMTSLRRHLGLHDISAEEYRAKFELPEDYSFVTSTYSARRAEIIDETINQQKKARKRARQRAPSTTVGS